ncbi:effector-associated constant component EACC1 [Nocardia takedensis]|uniref:effector-associated constant component EACC1 n=1 Tax=Nocardia takedensis TaxID=259390 RepID=UPI003F772F01
MSNPEGQLSIRADDRAFDPPRSLDWFHQDHALSGRAQPRPLGIRDGEVGDVCDLLMVGGGGRGLTPALARSLTTRPIHRRSDLPVTVARSDDASLTPDARRVKYPVVQYSHILIDPSVVS